MEIIQAEPGRLTECDECCDLKDKLINVSYGIMFFRLCRSCLQDAIRMLDEQK